MKVTSLNNLSRAQPDQRDLQLHHSNDFKRALSDTNSAANNLFGEDAEIEEIGEIEYSSIDKGIIEKLERLIKMETMETGLIQHVENLQEMLNGKL